MFRCLCLSLVVFFSTNLYSSGLKPYYHPDNFDVQNKEYAKLIRSAINLNDEDSRKRLLFEAALSERHMHEISFMLQTAFIKSEFFQKKRELFFFLAKINKYLAFLIEKDTKPALYKGVYIYQNDELFDLGRIYLDNKKPHSTKYLMENGIGAIGPDGDWIAICRLTNNYDKYFFEVGAAQYLQLQVNLDFQDDNQVKCLANDFVQDYWRQRVKGLLL